MGNFVTPKTRKEVRPVSGMQTVGYTLNKCMVGNAEVEYIFGDELTVGTSLKRQLSLSSKEIKDCIKEGKEMKLKIKYI
jgi:hypothetical protein